MFHRLRFKRVILMGGLGNQLFQYAYAIRLSRTTGSKILLNPNFAAVRKEDYGNPEISKYLLNSRTELEPQARTPKIIKKFVGTGLRVSNLKSYKFSSVFSTFLSLASSLFLSFYFREIIKVYLSRDTGYWYSKREKKSSFHVGYFQSFKFSDYKEDFEVLSKLIPRNINPEQDFYVDLAKTESPLVVHVRLADYRAENNFGIPSKDYYRAAIDFQFKVGNYKKIWLFSDEPEAALEFVPQGYLGLVRNVSLGLSDPIWSLEVMRLASGYVIANSTFSWWGAYLSHQEDPLVVYPKPWFQGMPDPIELCPPAWKPFPR
jgi:hypothetical protein